jgi:UDP-N-acetylmuramoyl-tripeptide--D-alanyl-D-alanine ligase
MGMNHPGEISDLVRIAQPNIVGITMVGRAHLEGLGSIESIAKAKEEIFSTPNPNFKTGIFNLDNPWTASMVKTYSDHQIQVLTFSSVHSKSDVHFQIASMDFDQLVLKGHIKGIEGSVEIPVFGQHNVTNLMFAACVGLAAGLSADQIWKGLANCRTTWGRNQRLTHPSGAEILFDGYNANPDSQKALIENLKLIRTDRPLVGVFGEMKELGANSEDLHQELGQMAGTADFAEVYFVGNYADNFKRGYSKTGKSPLHLFSAINTPMLEQISASLTKRPLITIKGSRGVRLEQILKYLSLI